MAPNGPRISGLDSTIDSYPNGAARPRLDRRVGVDAAHVEKERHAPVRSTVRAEGASNERVAPTQVCQETNPCAGSAVRAGSTGGAVIVAVGVQEGSGPGPSVKA